MRIIDPTLRSVVEVLEADALIVSRQLRDMADWIGAARAIGIPVHFYLDDNLPLMRNLGELNGAWDDYEPDTLRAALQDLDGVLASTEALAQSFREQALHRAVASLPISVPRAVTALRDAVEPARATQPRQRIVALFIGAHRLEGFRRVMMPALRDAATRDRATIDGSGARATGVGPGRRRVRARADDRALRAEPRPSLHFEDCVTRARRSSRCRTLPP